MTGTGARTRSAGEDQVRDQARVGKAMMGRVIKAGLPFSSGGQKSGALGEQRDYVQPLPFGEAVGVRET
jgi:hypothetical protein